MKKTALLVIAFLVLSCASDDDNNTSNIISSGWIALDPSPLPNLFFSRIVTDANINEETLSNASFQVYARSSNGIVYTIPHAFEDKYYFYTLNATTNEISFRGESTSGSTEFFNDFVEFRYTIILN